MRQAVGIGRQSPFVALDGSVHSEVCLDATDIIRAGGQHPLQRATPARGRKKWILILCGWTIVALLFAAQQIVVEKVQGSQVHWVIEGALVLVDWYIWAACTPLVIGLAK